MMRVFQIGIAEIQQGRNAARDAGKHIHDALRSG